MHSRTVEDYIKTIYVRQQEAGHKLVTMGCLAEAMNVAPGTVTSMVKTLSENGLVRYKPRMGLKLTNKGQNLALNVIRRHRLIELFLVEILKLNWTEVHIEAEELEHAVSARVLEKIDELLGHPEVDPHGDPIPSGDGTMTETAGGSLADCPEGHKYRISRILHDQTEFLHFAERHRLLPGTELTVLQHDTAAQTLKLRTAERSEVTIGLGAAEQILTEPVDK
jgi:DtxR family Mn-dependent transcriptional regulator